MSCEIDVENKPYIRPDIALNEIETIPEKVLDGLKVLCLCQFGEMRSWAAADILNEVGIPAVYLYGGLDGISNLEEEHQNNIAEMFAGVPNIVAILTSSEVKTYKEQLARMNSMRKDPVVISSSISDLIPTLVGVTSHQ